jgi:hypothetical protein
LKKIAVTDARMMEALNGAAHANTAFWLLQASILLYDPEDL